MHKSGYRYNPSLHMSIVGVPYGVIRTIGVPTRGLYVHRVSRGLISAFGCKPNPFEIESSEENKSPV